MAVIRVGVGWGCIQILGMGEIHSLFLCFQQGGRHDRVEEGNTVVTLPSHSKKWHEVARSHPQATLKAKNFLGVDTLKKFVINHQPWILNFRLPIKCLPHMKTPLDVTYPPCKSLVPYWSSAQLPLTSHHLIYIYQCLRHSTSKWKRKNSK